LVKVPSPFVAIGLTANKISALRVSMERRNSPSSVERGRNPRARGVFGEDILGGGYRKRLIAAEKFNNVFFEYEFVFACWWKEYHMIHRFANIAKFNGLSHLCSSAAFELETRALAIKKEAYLGHPCQEQKQK
jgi:hypothetical protein